MRKINKLFFLILLLLPAVAYTADMPCSYKTSGKNIITVCKDGGRTYYNSLAAVLSEFANNSGISAGQTYYLQPTEDKTGSNQQIADYVSRYIAAHLIHEGIGISKEKAEDTGEIGCSFDISGDILKISFDAGKKQDRPYSETFNIRNASAIKEEAALYYVQCGKCLECIECPKCPVVDCKECPECECGDKCPGVTGGQNGSGQKSKSFLTVLTDFIHTYKTIMLLFIGIVLILSALVWNHVSKPSYPGYKKTIWSIIFMLVAGITFIIAAFVGLISSLFSLIISAVLLGIFVTLRNKGIFKSY